MKKKIFAVLLALCMVLTMMPSMGFAEGEDGAGGSEQETTENKLYLIKDFNVNENTYTTSNYSCELELAKGESYSGMFAIMTGKNGGTATFEGIDGTKVQGSTYLACKKGTPDGFYEISLTENAVVGKTYQITYTDDAKTYTMGVNCVESTAPLYAVWLRDDEQPKNGAITEDQVSEKIGDRVNGETIDIPIGLEKAVQYFCYKNEKTNAEDPDTYTVLDVNLGENSNIAGDNLTFRMNEYDGYCCLELTDSAAVNSQGTITITNNEEKYSLAYVVTLPYIGAYKSTSFNATNLIPGQEFLYDGLDVDEQDGKKTIYFAVDTGERDTVGQIEMLECTSSAITSVQQEQNGKKHLAVSIANNVINAEFEVHATVSWTEGTEIKTNETYWTFRITGNVLKGIRVNQDTILKEGDIISTEYVDDIISVAPAEEEDFFLGIPAGEADEYEIVAAELSEDSKDAIILERTGRRNQAYALSATEEAELDKTYYIEATSDGKTYRIPVNYELPYVGAYKAPERTVANYISYRDLYEDAVKNGNKFYIIVPDTENEIRCEEMPDGLTAKDAETDTTKGIQYIEVSIDKDKLEEGEISVKVGNNTRWIWLSKNEGGDSDDEKVDRTDYTVIPCTKEGANYIPIELDSVEDYSGIEAAAQFFVGDNEDRTFYVLTTKTGTLTLKELDYYRKETKNEIANVKVQKVEEDCTYNKESYTVWKVVVGEDFSGALRVGFAFDGKLANYEGKDDFGPYTKFMWILDENYDEPNYNQYDNDNILLCVKKPIDGSSYESMEDFEEKIGLVNNNGDASGTKYINLSRPLDDENNAIYILHTEGTTLHDESAVESAYAIEGSGIGRGYHTGGYFRQILNEEIYNYTRNVGTVTIDGEKMTITKATLKDSYGANFGANFMDSVFYLTKSENSDEVKVEGYASVYLQKGMDVVMRGADENAATIDNDYNKASNAVGYGDVAEKLSFEKQADGIYKAFYREACANVSDEGTGILTSFCVDLEPGYVVEKITNNEGTQLGFTSERRFLYALLDKDGNPIYDATTISNLGWHGGARSSADNGENRTLIDVGHCVAAYVPDYMKSLQHSELGGTNIDNLVEFLTKDKIAEAGYSVELRTAYTVYTVYFDPDNEDTKRNEIVFHIKKADIGNDIGATNNGSAFSMDATLADMQNVNRTQIEKFLKALDFDEFSLLNVYEMTAKDQTSTDRQGLYNITIPMSKLASGTALKDYKVVYFEEGDNGKVYPMEVETTYVGGKGIVFTTGHFSNYAVIYKPANTDGGSSGGGSGSGGSAVIPSTDTVTNKAEDKTTDTSATTTATVKNTTTTTADGTKTVAAKVDTATAGKIVEKAVENKSAEVVVDAATAKTVTETAAGTKTEITLPATTVSDIANKTEAAVTIKADAAEIKLDKEAVKAVAEAAGTAGEVKLQVETVAQDENKVQVALKLVTSKGTVSDFKGGNVSVTVKLNAALAVKPVVCVYIDAHSTYHKVGGQKNADGTFTFKTGHFSSYAVMAEEEADKIIAEQTAKVEKLVSTLSLKARSAKTTKGYIKVTLTADADAIKQVEDLGYTVKYKFYRSTKKAKGYKAKLEGTGKTYTNTTGKKGTKYYYKARVMVYDAQGALVTKTELKQCRYASRTR